MIAVPMILARGFSFPPVGQSARGVGYLPGIPRCTLSSAHLCQEAADQNIDNLAYGLPGPVGVEVVISVREVGQLHDSKVRHGAAACLTTRRGKELAPKQPTFARGLA